MALLVKRFVGLRDVVAVFLIRGQVADLARNQPGLLIVDAVGCFKKTVAVDPGVSRKRVDQADVGTFRRFDGAHAPVMGRVDVADLKVGTLPREASRPQG